MPGVLTNDVAAANARDIAAAAGVEGVVGESSAAGTQYRHPDTDLFHRLDGPAVYREAVPEDDVHAWEAWYVAGNLHRLDGPAQTSVNGQLWWVNGVQHRLDGPASECPPVGNGGRPVREWWVNGHEVTQYCDREWLSSLYDAGKIAELETVLTLWRPDGPTTFELSQAVRAASA